MIRQLERSAATAWPALESQWIGPWECRQAAGYTQRGNSCLPLDEPETFTTEQIDAVENWYRTLGQEVIFKCPDDATWSALDHALEHRGYRVSTPSEILTCPLKTRTFGPPVWGFLEATAFDAQWFQGYSRASGMDAKHLPTARQLSACVPRPRVFRIHVDGADLAWAFAAQVGTEAWIFDVVVDEEKRSQGWGRALMAGILESLAGQGLVQAHLQVLSANQRARSLYRSLGFVPTYAYHYRRKP